MITLLRNLFIVNWPRKLIALIAGIVIWFLVSHSITITRTIPNVPVRVLNIPADKTVEGLLPGGLLADRLTLTLTGSRSLLDTLAGQDIEVVTDAAGRPDQWTITVTKRNLVAKSADIDIARGVTSVSPVELTVELSPLVTDRIPITVTPPIGEPPKGYLYLDVWPQRLYQTVKGPKPQVERLKEKGLRLTFSLSDISVQELDELQEKAGDQDEIRFFVPDAWKRVVIPFMRDQAVEINDPEAAYLHIDFLRRDLLPLDSDIPLSLFFPLEYSLTLNPGTYTLASGTLVATKNGIFILTEPAYVRNVSRRFLDTVRDSLEIAIKVVPPDVAQPLPWSLQFIDPKQLEESYVKASLPPEEGDDEAIPSTLRTKQLRERFRKYMRDLELLRANQQPLVLYPELGAETITLTDTKPTDTAQ
jgi:hypothetical protein